MKGIGWEEVFSDVLIFYAKFGVVYLAHFSSKTSAILKRSSINPPRSERYIFYVACLSCIAFIGFMASDGENVKGASRGLTVFVVLGLASLFGAIDGFKASKEEAAEIKLLAR